jgi:hypothetical protein
MNGKGIISRRGARRCAGSDISPAQSPTVRAESKCSDADMGVNPKRDFQNRQARTDAAVRIIPGLHDFGS